MVNLTVGASRPQFERDTGPLELLLACHERIRRFSALAVKLTASANAPPAELAQAAAGVHRYFTVALPLHVLDEDLSIAPRLEPLVSAAVREASAQMSSQHRSLETSLEGLLRRWEELSREPVRLQSLLPELEADARALELAFEEHLVLEEGLVFPALSLLPATDISAIVREMQDRRRAPLP